MDSSFDGGLLGDPGIRLSGSEFPLEEALALVRNSNKRLPICVVEELIILCAMSPMTNKRK